MNTRKDKQLSECDTRIKEIRTQLNEQLKCLDQHTDSRCALIGDIQEFFKRKSEIETEYARKLDLLSEKYLTKQRNLYAIKKEQPDLDLQSPVTCWFQMLEQCQRESKDHGMLANIYMQHIIPRLQTSSEDATRLHKKTREIASECHEDLLQDLRKLYQAMQLYQVYWAESTQAEQKLKQAEKQFEKRNDRTVESPKLDNKVKRSTSFRKLEKLREKRLSKFSEAKLKSVKARNEYILQLESTNATLVKFYGSDVTSLLETMSTGYHSSFQRMWRSLCEAESSACHSNLKGLELLQKSVDEIEPFADKTKFLDSNSNAFSQPPMFKFSGNQDDGVKQISLALPQLHKEVDKRCSEIKKTIMQMRIDEEELKKTVSATRASMNQLSASVTNDLKAPFVHTHDVAKDTSGIGVPVLVHAQAPHPYSNKDTGAVRSKILDMESFYIEKFRDYLQKSNQLNRIDMKRILLEKALNEDVPVDDSATFARIGPPRVLPKPSKRPLGRRRRSKHTNITSSTGDFSSNLQLYLKETGRSIPLVVESCIRIINMYGLHHQGIFRVPGSHQDITEMKSLFEAGEDPISDREDDADINSVAGLLKLYFRQLDEKLFPQYIFEDLEKCAHVPDIEERVTKIRQIILNIPESVLIVMRYLFAFLNHLSENNDENMMDAYNIAVCFGPTLLPVPDNCDQVTCQANVNEVIKTIVVHHDEIFPSMLDGPVYEKVMTSDDFEAVTTTTDAPPDGENAAAENSTSHSVHSSVSDDDSDQILEGFARYDYKGRSDRELSFFKGDTLTLYRRASDDWWEGNYKGKDGLVPHAYISVHENSDDVSSSRAESEVSLDSGGTPQSPAHRASPFFNLQQQNRRSTSEVSKLSPSSASSSSDSSKLPIKTKSLDRYNNVQDYIRQQRIIANKAASKAGRGLTPESPNKSVIRSESLKQGKSSEVDEGYSSNVFTTSDVDPSNMSFADRIAKFKRTSNSTSTSIDPETIQKKSGFVTLPRIVAPSQSKDIDDTMRNALDQLQALDMNSPLSAHKATPDVVLDTLEHRGKQVSASGSPVHSNASTLSSSESKNTDRNSPSNTSWKKGKNKNNNNNNNASHYQVPTHRYQGMAAMATEHDFSSSAPDPMKITSQHQPLRMTFSSKPKQTKQSVRKTAL